MSRISCLSHVFVVAVLATNEVVGERKLSQELLLGYEPETIVTDYAALDLDLSGMREQLQLHNEEGFDNAAALYRKGGNSLSYAKLDLEEELKNNVPYGVAVTGTSSEGSPVSGFVHKHSGKGDTTLEVAYKVAATQREYVDCQVGGNPDPNTDGCFEESGEITIDGQSDPISYHYDPMEDNENGRVLHRLPHNFEKLMGECDQTCPKNDFKKFVDYYGAGDYSDQWVTAVFNQKPTDFTNGNVDFTGVKYAARQQAILTATVDMTVWMKVIERMEVALDNCRNICDDDCFLDRVGPWDQAVAFYVGSIAKTKFGVSGEFPYSTAEKSCVKFGTCVSTKGAHVNVHVMKLFNKGKEELLKAKCDTAQDAKERIVKLMQIPLIQNTLYSAYELAQLNENSEWTKVVAATNAAAVLPIVHNCSAPDAKIIYDNMKLDKISRTNFAAVKDAFERNYECMGAYCNEIGAVLNDDGRTYPGAEACVHVVGSSLLSPTSDDSDDNKAMKLGLGVGLPFALLLAFAACFSVCVHDLNKGKEYDGMEGEPEAPKEASEPKEATDEESAPAELT